MGAALAAGADLADRRVRQHDQARQTEVGVTVSAVGAGTRVTLEHRSLDAYAGQATEMAGIFVGPGGWPDIRVALAGAG